MQESAKVWNKEVFGLLNEEKARIFRDIEVLYDLEG